MWNSCQEFEHNFIRLFRILVVSWFVLLKEPQTHDPSFLKFLLCSVTFVWRKGRYFWRIILLPVTTANEAQETIDCCLIMHTEQATVRKHILLLRWSHLQPIPAGFPIGLKVHNKNTDCFYFPHPFRRA